MENLKPTAEVRVSREICLSEIPRSAALTVEGADYVGAFCGLECYQEVLKEPQPGVPQAAIKIA